MTAVRTFFWQGIEVPFRAGESVAAALSGSNIHGFGKDNAGSQTRYFCGIGACQCCLVRVDGRTTEACLEPVHAGMIVTALEDGDA
ncbi:ferredoxin [Sinorhizobium medicae]|uniref:Ferredoxin n=1 Tax=Sinorhizobium medicae TaxID=110321 RepID=A0A508X5K0_9HYPH|nr:2Fe-2S iron-sulfur cluster-binding protein [Sinorhizobium medicae]MDX0521980.1 2Fe-2S iron-sulfur cluster binding domain-containing protein [Sinorhizobium medicae]MDX0633797.1 2Fe-2S iron-sulfur cluster binding domain-containing protein [Sinorhizobium medicae]MDX0694340.1 2Fe-2S iron-sulfur cluster binding domain-containing protein [Sinorhizobium medicae]MDX0743523.1 2Fe-2S iron-sulfur cluster binding domain-containing protein [Sinorhizobium medicae]MDX0769840.1 2Fe-2S iron-sulfur cluster b